MFSSINTCWTLVGAFLVYFMQAGFALCEAGFTRAKNTGNIPENTKGAGGINSVSAFAFDGKSIVPLCKSVKGSC